MGRGEILRAALPVAVLAVGASASLALLRGRPLPSAPPAPASLPVVEVIEAVPRQLRGFVRAQGSVEPRAEIELAAEIAGRVARVSPALESGAFFDAGEVLVELDDREASLELRRAEARARGASAERELAEEQLERLRALARRGVADAASLSAATHRREVAAAGRSEAEALRQKARLDLEKTRVRAPFDGRVRSRAVSEGQWIRAGAVIATVYATDHAEVRLPVRLSELLLLGTSAAFADPDRAPSHPVTIEAELGGHRHRWSGQIVRTGAAISPETRMIELVARVEDPYGLREGSTAVPPLLAGLFVEARIAGPPMTGVYVLPDTALSRLSEVLLVDADGRLAQRPIEILQRESGEVVVGAGLAPGERVCRWAAPLSAGLRVDPRRSEWAASHFTPRGPRPSWR